MLRPWIALLLLGASLCAQDRVLILGVDGMDHELTRRWMEEGKLPELARLRDDGSFQKLIPSNPAQSPTSWASLTTGLNPGGHGIQGFLRLQVRDGRIVPALSMAERVEQPMLTSGLRVLGYLAAFLVGALPLWFLRKRRRLAAMVACGLAALLLLTVRWLFANLPESIHRPHNLRSGTALWEALDAEGIAVTSLGAPCAFPAPDLEHGHLLCGLGVPDLQGTAGTWLQFRDGPVPGDVRVTQMGGKELTLRRKDGSDVLEGMKIAGPISPLDGERLVVDVDMRVDGDAVVVTVQGETTRLEPGRFSDLVPISFDWGELGAGIRGLVRFRLQQVDPHVVVLLKPVNVDASHQVPFAPVTAPIEYGVELTDRGGAFETLGWATATNPYQDRLIDDATILEDARALVARRTEMTLNAAKRDDWRVLLSVLSTPDRVQHMFWRDLDTEHPNHDAEKARRRGNVILESYQAVDALVGRLRREALKDGDVLLVVSDHGFASFRYAVNLNRWLAGQGLLVARTDGRRTLQNHLGSDKAFEHIDWSKTKAFNMGLGRIWLNTKSRFPDHGILTDAEADALMDDIRSRLLAMEYDKRSVVKSVAKASEIYHGARANESADLIIGFQRGFRVSWNACLGGIDEPMFFENMTRWSGDHCSVDPELVPGILFSSRKLPEGRSNVVDVYPTLRALLGLAPASNLDGRSLLEKR